MSALFEVELVTCAQEFRRLAETAWSPDTAYPGFYDAANPAAGQCGVTSYRLGHFLSEVMSYPLDAFEYRRGVLRYEGEPVGENHSWLGVRAPHGLVYDVDLTGDQYGLVETTFVAPSGSLHSGRSYAVEKATPLADYDTAKMAGRLSVFAERVQIAV
jgi:hypothetical protein